MYKVSLHLAICIFISIVGLAQNRNAGFTRSKELRKPTIDSSVFDKWSSVERLQITKDGRYVAYAIRNNEQFKYTTVLKGTISGWEMKIPGLEEAQFSSNSKNAFYILNDTLKIIRLGTSRIEAIPNVQAFQIPSKGSGEWIAFKLDSLNEMVLMNIHSRIRRYYKFVNYFVFSEDGNSIALQKEEKSNDSVSQSLSLVDINTGRQVLIWQGTGFLRMIMNPSASQIAISMSDRDASSKSIWFYDRKLGPASILVNDTMLAKDGSLLFDDLSRFDKSGKYLFFTVSTVVKRINDSSVSSPLNIWSYQDTQLQALQFENLRQNQRYTYAVDLLSHKIVVLTKDNENIIGSNRNDDIFLIDHYPERVDPFEYSWNTGAEKSYILRSISHRKDVLLNVKGLNTVILSPEGKYVLLYDKELGNYISYEIATGVYRNITSSIDVSWINSYRDDLSRWARGICGWLPNDSSVLIYDRFDIWRIDPLGMNKPVNLTNGYGSKHNIIFYQGLSESSANVFSESNPLILNALNLNNKENGFFRMGLKASENPVELTMGNYIYKLVKNPYVGNGGIFPIKSENKNRFVVLRMKANESPNYFFTTDFRTFTQLSKIYPERAYNWYNTELHSWRKPDGSLLQGILFKPENFDSLKKYPVIFYYYEKRSFSLNEYIAPSYISGACNINIPTYVSNGYLVFSPDIDYVIGDPMQGTYDAVVSAASYVSSFSFVDRERMGIGGCSFGGLQTNYLVTHTNLFAAAYSACSMSDMISAYNGIPTSTSLQTFFESGQARMGGTLWTNKAMYIKNSPIFNADKVSTPLLLMHTTNDGICSFSQALEFFTALRRLGKRVWLLEYTQGNHALRGESAIDYSVRLSQFFNHYLKGAAPPQWMTRGIPARMRGIDKGYELDHSIKTPGKGLLKE